MANKYLSGLKNTKIRTLLILGTVLLIALIIIIYFIVRKPNPLKSQESSAAAPPEITAIPGGVTSERYQELQEEENRRRAEAAKEAGTSAVATIIGARSKDNLSGRETFGIEGLLGECKCPPGGGLPADRAAALLAELEANPDRALELLKNNPGLAKELCKQKPELALNIMAKDPEAAKIILTECPELARAFAERNPEAFKKLMLANPELAKMLAEKDPALFKKLMLEDPAFANALAASNPELVKNLMRNDSEFAKQLAKSNPELVKNLMKNDPDFAKLMALQNPDMVKELMLNDPEFARLMAQQNPDMVKALMAADPEFARALQEKVPELMNILSRTATQPPVAALPLSPTAAPRAEVALTEAQRNQLQTLLAAMQTQSQAIYQAWNEVNPQQFVQGEWVAKLEEQARAAAEKKPVELKPGAVPPGILGPGQVLFKAGEVLFAVLDTSVNSDEPGPVLATVVSGKYKGAKLLGTVSTSSVAGGLPPEKVTLTFNTMNIKEFPSSIAIQAVAIDPDTARTAMATDVDNHYLLRYGTMFAAAFMTGYAKVITSMGTTQTTAANGGSTTTITPQLSSRQQIYAALGEVGKKWGEAVSRYANIPPTITVDSGTGFGLLFLSDVGGS